MREVTRREAIKVALRGAAYTAPIILASQRVAAAPGMISGASADLAVTISASPPEPIFGITENVTVTLTNNGPSPATTIRVSALFASLSNFGTVTAITQSRGSVQVTFGNANWVVLTLPVGASETLTAAVQVTARFAVPPPSATVSAAILSSDQPDPQSRNNSDSLTLTEIFPIGVQSATITQRATAATCGGGSPAQFVQSFALQLAYDEAGQALDIYISPNDASPVGAFTKLGSVMTDGQGRASFAGSATVTTQTATPPTSVTFNVVDQGNPPQVSLSSKTFLVTTTVPCGTP
ncbi:MAG: DUF11 domain-containing protein [Thermomicrobiales bacterium]